MAAATPTMPLDLWFAAARRPNAQIAKAVAGQGPTRRRKGANWLWIAVAAAKALALFRQRRPHVALDLKRTV
jgi:hypothetical protein